MLNYIYYLVYGEEEEIEPSEKTLRSRHEMLKQIKFSKLKLKKTRGRPFVLKRSNPIPIPKLNRS